MRGYSVLDCCYLFWYMSCMSCILSTSSSNAYTGHKLLMVSFDGFRWDYTQYADTPNFDKIKATGTHAPYMNGVYPSLTLPSFYSIATGMYPESHGLIGNEFYDPVLNETFNVYRTESVWYEGGEPIWVTAAKQGLKTATYYCPGTNAEIQGYRPDHYIPYNSSTPFEDKVSQVITWLIEYDSDFVILYFSEPDHVGHFTGPAPGSNKTIEKIRYLDKIMGYLSDEIERNNISDLLNMIVVSDHGMTRMNEPQSEFAINIYDYVDQNDIEQVVCGAPLCHILPTEGNTNAVYQSLKGAHPNITVYKKEDIPYNFHFKHNKMILPIVVMANEGWTLITNASQKNSTHKGMHGYDNRLMSMKPFFMAKGPDIKVNYTSELFSQIDLYPLMCRLLGIIPVNNINGSLSITGQMLDFKGSQSIAEPDGSVLVVITILGAILCLIGFGITLLLVLKCCMKLYNTDKPSNRAMATDYVAL